MACILWLVVKRCLFRLATVEPVEICFMLHTRVCVVDRDGVNGTAAVGGVNQLYLAIFAVLRRALSFS